jgi:hypothetical protein
MSQVRKDQRIAKRKPRQAKSRKNRGGRPTIDDDLLFSHRDGFLALFTSLWGQFGWTLRRVRTREDVVAAFSSIEVPIHLAYLVQLFTRTTASTATGRDARHAKRAVNAAREKAADLERALRPLAERVRQTQRSMERALSKDGKVHEDIVRVHRSRLMAYAPLRAQADDLDERLKALEAAQFDAEAAYAQNELLSFLKGKYKLNPRNLANALAGLPQMGWEQSFKRCGKEKTWLWPSNTYRVFEMIVKCADESSDRFLSAMDAAILALPNRKPADIQFRRSLCANRLYFRRAIEETAVLPDLGESRAYRAFDAYMRNISHGRSDDEQLLASLEELDPVTQPSSL